jgi:microcystin-dependent protein
MASTYTTNLRLTKQGDGENPNSWGQILNDGVISLADEAIAGYTTISIGSAATVNLTANDGADDQSRSAFLEVKGSVGTVATSIFLVIPNKTKSYAVLNKVSANATSNVVMMRVAGNTGVTLNRSSTVFQHVICDGTSVYNVDQSDASFNTLEVSGSVSVGGTAIFSSTVTVVGAGTFKNNVSVSGNVSVGGNVVAAEFYGGGANLTGIVALPTGAILPFAGASAPSGLLLCFGQAISRSTYSGLFTAIGTVYGVGDGSTTFNIPDLRGRAVAGQDDMGGTSANRLTDQSGGVDGDVLGDTGGAETHTLTTAQLASHSHDVSPTNSIVMGGGSSHGASGGSEGLRTLSLDNTGGGGAHNNVQPTIILNYIIKT